MTSGYDYKEFAILFVDDEEQARKYFKLAFENEFSIVTAASVDEALDVVSSGNPRLGMVVTDQRMPQKAGTDLLSRVRRTHPELVRILTTAHADLDSAIDAVNSGAVFKYLVKPWELRELRVTLRHAMEYFLLRRERDSLLREKLSSLQHMLVADRVRSLAILAEGLSSQVRNTMTALRAYIQLAQEQELPQPGTRLEQRVRNIQWETEDAAKHLLKVVQSVTSAVVEPVHEFHDSVSLSDVVSSAWIEVKRSNEARNASIELEVLESLPELGCDRGMLERMFINVFRSLLPASDGGSAPCLVRVRATERCRLFDTDGVLIEIRRPGVKAEGFGPSLLPSWVLGGDDDSPDLLAAFFAVHHHGGTISLDQADASSGGYRITLPFDPRSVTRLQLDADAAQKLFSDLPRWEALERGA